MGLTISRVREVLGFENCLNYYKWIEILYLNILYGNIWDNFPIKYQTATQWEIDTTLFLILSKFSMKFLFTIFYKQFI